ICLPDRDIHALVQMQPGDTLNFSTFLSKFQTLRQFYRSPEVIERVTREAIEDAARDSVVYLELRFTPVALGRLQGYSAARVMDWVARSAHDAARDCGITVRLIASINRHEPVEIAEEVARLAAERIDQGIIGLDLAGNEAQFPALPFAGIFREARESGLHLTIHAGEWGGAENIREAIEVFGAERIGHGVRVIEDPAVMDLAFERGTAFEVCVTSNYQSGVVSALTEHPLPRLLNAGLSVTLNTDDPSISGITLSDEYILAQDDLGLNSEILSGCILNGAKEAFLPQNEKELLKDRLKLSLDLVMS
ncbi:MAG: adenosine deaminase, partial [Anaerolineaceae bacterium]|nr:adenosine deaminase [Anaerolineaceae bacterium]